MRAPSAGSVTIEAKAFTLCKGYSAPLTQTFQIAAPPAVCPTGINFPAQWCTDNPNLITLAGAQSGLTYTLTAYSVVPSRAGVTFAPTATPGVIAATLYPDSRGVYPRSFGVLVTVTSPCPGSSPGVVTCVSAPLFPNSVTTNAYPCGTVEPGPGGGKAAPAPTLYPNPTTGKVDIRPGSPDSRYEAVKVLDIRGSVVASFAATQAEGVTRFDITELPPGLYQVQLFSGGRLESQRLVKE